MFSPILPVLQPSTMDQLRTGGNEGTRVLKEGPLKELCSILHSNDIDQQKLLAELQLQFTI